MSNYDQHLDKNPANYTPLTPLTFLERSAYIYPNRLSAIHGQRRYSLSLWGKALPEVQVQL